jgi:UDP-N-acetyl-2-amino-2-deoxyglucuronate dehydrogenase
MSVSFAIIGCGRIAKRHAEQIAKVGKLVAVCDVVEAKASELGELYGAKVYDSIEKLLENESKIDVVSICTPNGLHAEHSILVLQANKHVLCEKPLCIQVEDGKRMIAVAEKVGRKLFVVKSARYNPLVIALKRMSEANTLGKILSFNLNCNWNRPIEYFKEDWRGTLALDGGVLYTQFSHYIDILLWLLGEHKNMSGYRKNLFHQAAIEFEDTGAIALEMKNGAVGTIQYSINAYEKNQEISLNIVAEKATIKIGGSYMNEILYQCPELIDDKITSEINNPNDYTFYKGSVSNHDKIYEDLIKALDGKHSTITEGQEALKTVEFIETFYKKTDL